MQNQIPSQIQNPAHNNTSPLKRRARIAALCALSLVSFGTHAAQELNNERKVPE